MELFKKFSIQDAFTFSFKSIIDHVSIFAVYFCAVMFCGISFLMISMFYVVAGQERLFFLGYGFWQIAVYFLISTLFSIGWAKIGFDILKNKPVGYQYFYQFYVLAPRVFIVEIISFYGIIFLCMIVLSFLGINPSFVSERLLDFSLTTIVFGSIGTVCVSLLAFYCSVRFYFARYFIVDKNQSVLQSLQSSWNITRNVFIDVGLYQFICLMIRGIGWIVYPFCYLADIYVYHQLTKKME